MGANFQTPVYLILSNARTLEKLIENPNEIQLNDRNETEYLLGNPPGCMMRVGLAILFGVSLIFFSLAWFIKYPDVIPATVSFVTENPAIKVMARSGGKIEQLAVGDNEAVVENQLLAVIENPASVSDVIFLKEFVENTQAGSSQNDFSTLKIRDNLSLGELQNSYASLVLKIKNYRRFLGQTGAAQKVKSIENRIENIEKLNANISKQKTTLAEEISLAKSDFDRNVQLKNIGEISELELEKSKTQYLQYKRQTEDLENEILNNNVQIAGLETQIIELRENRTMGGGDKNLAIEEDLQRLKSEIVAWEQTYLIHAPVAGKVAYSKNWSDRQFINPNEELLTIVPTTGSGKIVGRALLPISRSGKVKIGQTGNVRLGGFPFQEFGILKTKVKSIALVPQGENYLLELELTNGLKTTYDKIIPFRQEMQGDVDIVTEDRRVVDRVFDKLLSILKNT